MKIQYCSDLHMEFHENMRFMKSLPLEPVGDVLVIAGDVGYLVDSTVPHLRFWKWAVSHTIDIFHGFTLSLIHITISALEQRHFGDVLNAAYATELGNYIADSRISAWIYGHSHHSTDLMIDNTHLVSNPLGYVFCGENTNFNDSAVIEV